MKNKEYVCTLEPKLDSIKKVKGLPKRLMFMLMDILEYIRN